MYGQFARMIREDESLMVHPRIKQYLNEHFIKPPLNALSVSKYILGVGWLVCDGVECDSYMDQ